MINTWHSGSSHQTLNVLMPSLERWRSQASKEVVRLIWHWQTNERTLSDCFPAAAAAAAPIAFHWMHTLDQRTDGWMDGWMDEWRVKETWWRIGLGSWFFKRRAINDDIIVAWRKSTVRIWCGVDWFHVRARLANMQTLIYMLILINSLGIRKGKWEGSIIIMRRMIHYHHQQKQQQ